MMSVRGGVNPPPEQAHAGLTVYGFTVSERVEVIDEKSAFKGWHGHVCMFEGAFIGVELDESPRGEGKNGQWFLPKDIRKAPQ